MNNLEVQLKNILEELINQELFLHHPKANITRTDLENIIDARFYEVGALGRYYSREDAINILIERSNNSSKDVWETKGFHCLEIALDTYLLTYTLIQDKRITHRASIWLRSDQNWKILYHQGTIVQK